MQSEQQPTTFPQPKAPSVYVDPQRLQQQVARAVAHQAKKQQVSSQPSPWWLQAWKRFHQLFTLREDYHNILRYILLGAGLLLQVCLLVLGLMFFVDLSPWFYFFGLVISLLVVLHLVSQFTPSSYRIAWIILVAFVPVLGGILYLFYGLRSKRHLQRNLAQQRSIMNNAFHVLQKEGPLEVEPLDPLAQKESHYLQEQTSYPIYSEEQSAYLPSGEAQFAALKAAIANAKDFVFLEYFIISEGSMWEEIFALLCAKAQAGVDCRVIYDDIGSMHFLPSAFIRRLEAAGIQVRTFNPLRIFLSARYNYRDHRKICVVDGRIALTGGTNIADEYINRKVRFGHWKDTGVLIQGKAVWSFTVMYLTLWAQLTGGSDEIRHFWQRSEANLRQYAPLNLDDVLQQAHMQANAMLGKRLVEQGKAAIRALPTSPVTPVSPKHLGGEQGLLIPFDDTPFDGLHQAVNLYRSMINHATESIDIITPYLIIDDQMLGALCTAAQSGVRVRIMTPHIPDKPLVHMTTRSYYPPLIEAGCEVYEYEPGFVHAKSLVVDGQSAVIGTINFDYRSLYLHMECAIWFHQSPIIQEITKDFENTLKHCLRMQAKPRHMLQYWGQALLRLVAPLL